MKKEYVNIVAKQKLSDVMEYLPTNTIVNKVLTGIGATYLELKSKRNSIIIEPNVPVIEGKEKQHSDILGVFENVKTFHIIKYLHNTDITYKKIVTTPESFEKVKRAMEELEIDMYSDYFLLFDECDRTSKDVDFRENIIKPMEDFFLFSNKAFISATAEIPSDVRFSEQHFKIVEIVPQFDHSRDIQFVSTNNPKATLRHLLEQIVKNDDKRPVFIFFNSIKGIVSTIEELKILKSSVVFCSPKSASTIRHDKIKTHTQLSPERIGRYNFMTARYYSAVDIELKDAIKPHVVMITDLNASEHTMIDPHSDAIQIVGRFRDGTESVTFISNFDPEIVCMTPEECTKYLSSCEYVYNTLRTMRDTAQDDITKRVMEEAMDSIFFSDFVNDDGSKNYYMYDSFLNKERVKSYYLKEEYLVKEFWGKLNKHYKLSRYEMKYALSSKYWNVRNIRKYGEVVKELVDCLDIIFNEGEDQQYTIFDRESVYETIKQKYPSIPKAYRILGRDELLRIGTCSDAIEEALFEHVQKKGFQDYDFNRELAKRIKTSGRYLQKDVLDIFDRLTKKYGHQFKRTIKDLGQFFDIELLKKNGGTRYVRILRKKF